MAQFTLNIPSEKLQSFLTMMVQTGFNKSIEAVKYFETKELRLQGIPIKHNSLENHPYYDRDFYNNDILID